MTKAVTLRAKPKVSDVRQWVIALGVLTAGNMTRVEAEMKLRAYVPLLQDDFPAGAFCQRSLQHVAQQCRYFPSYADVVLHLRAWWREHRPAPPALPPPPPEPERPAPTPEEIEHVHRLTQEVVAHLRAADAARAADRQAQLDALGVTSRPRAIHLPPDVLDKLNPLPNGRKRTDAVTATTTVPISPASDAALVDTDAT
jgi:hypothetical protein